MHVPRPRDVLDILCVGVGDHVSFAQVNRTHYTVFDRFSDDFVATREPHRFLGAASEDATKTVDLESKYMWVGNPMRMPIS